MLLLKVLQLMIMYCKCSCCFTYNLNFCSCSCCCCCNGCNCCCCCFLSPFADASLSPWYMSGVAAPGAVSLASSAAAVLPSAVYTVMRNPPPTPLECALTRPLQKRVAMAASTALPLRRRTSLKDSKMHFGRKLHTSSLFHTARSLRTPLHRRRRRQRRSCRGCSQRGEEASAGQGVCRHCASYLRPAEGAVGVKGHYPSPRRSFLLCL